MAFDGQAHIGKAHQPAGIARDGTANLACANESACGFDAFAFAIFYPETRYFAVLYDVHTTAIGAARIPPSDSVMTYSAAAMLGQPPLDREPRVIGVQEGIAFLDLGGGQHVGIGPVQDHRIAAPDKRIALPVRMDQVQDAALTDHGIVIDVLFKTLP